MALAASLDDQNKHSGDQGSLGARVDALLARYGQLSDEDFLAVMIKDVFPGKIAVSSSFGIETAVLLDMVARIDRSTPVVFLETGFLFPETLAYKDMLEDRLRLTDIRVITPDRDIVAQYDPDNSLHKSDPDACCHIRKVLPLRHAMAGFDAWITGRKQFHGGDRAAMPVIDYDEQHIKVNPLARWDQESIQAAFDNRALPRHPLEDKGYTSVGCQPCTALPDESGDPRSGRWKGQDKTECGIHKAPWFGQDI